MNVGPAKKATLFVKKRDLKLVLQSNLTAIKRADQKQIVLLVSSFQ